MPLRNIDFDSAIRQIVTTEAEVFEALRAVVDAKVKECKLKGDANLAITKVPRHGGRRNPLRGQMKGGADINVRGLIGWAESIAPLSEITSEEFESLEPAPKQERQDMLNAYEQLRIIQATLNAQLK